MIRGGFDEVSQRPVAVDGCLNAGIYRCQRFLNWGNEIGEIRLGVSDTILNSPEPFQDSVNAVFKGLIVVVVVEFFL